MDKNYKTLFLFLASLFLSAALLYAFYDHTWSPLDDGAYAHVAERILAGEILNLDVHDVHAGYINFINTASLSLFGNQMVSLRMPLVILGIIQSLLLFKLFLPMGLPKAFLSSLTITSLSFILFSNPTANWYGLFIAISIIVWLEWVPRNAKIRIFGVGFLLMTAFLFRQLSGIIIGLGTVCYLLFESHKSVPLKKSLVIKSLFFIMLLGLLGYLFLKIPLSALLLFGFCPVMILGFGLIKVTNNDRDTLIMIGKLLSGATVALIPLLSYHIYHGSLSSWYNDTVISALMLTELPFIQEVSYFVYILYCLNSVITSPSVDVVLNAIIWLSLILAAPIIGVLVLRSIYINWDKNNDVIGLKPFPIICVFFALVAVHYQIPIYLFYTVGLSMCGILWMSHNFKPRAQNICMALIGLVSVLTVYYHAGTATTRLIVDQLKGKEIASEKVFLGGNINLWVFEDEAIQYQYLKEKIDQNVAKDETIFSFPTNATIYYISGRTNPFRFFNSAFGIVTPQQFEDILQTFKNDPPRMVFYNPNDKYGTAYSEQLIEYIQKVYVLQETVLGMEVYLYKDSK